LICLNCSIVLKFPADSQGINIKSAQLVSFLRGPGLLIQAMDASSSLNYPISANRNKGRDGNLRDPVLPAELIGNRRVCFPPINCPICDPYATGYSHLSFSPSEAQLISHGNIPGAKAVRLPVVPPLAVWPPVKTKLCKESGKTIWK
jgi:hypothetical protein